MNLLNNAIDAIDNKGEISITTKKLKDKIKISIKDNGMGIKPEFRKRCLSPSLQPKKLERVQVLDCLYVLELLKGIKEK